MRKTLSTWMLAVALFGAAEAQASASFANRMLGISGGYSAFTANQVALSTVIPFALEAGYYIESGFDLYLRVQLGLIRQGVGFGVDRNSPGFLFGIGGQLGIRYLFLEESVRPYVGIHLAGLGLPSDLRIGPPGYGGLGACGGVDFFLADSISLGVRGYIDFLMSVGTTGEFLVMPIPGAVLAIATYF
jgi:outer membrane protein